MRAVLHVFFLFSILVSCTNEEQPVRAKGGRYYGGSFSFISPERVTNLFPLATNDVHSQRVNAQVFETLLRINGKSMKTEPGLAESYSFDARKNEYTFNLRKDVLFHEDDCFDHVSRELTAEDVKFTLEMACSGLEINKMGAVFSGRIKGADEFYKKTRTRLNPRGVTGIRAIDKYTLAIRLEKPFIGFEQLLTMSTLGVFSQKAYEFYAKNIVMHPIGTGPFRLNKLDNDGLVLLKNTEYWRKDNFGNRLPFIDQIYMRYNPNKKDELRAFHNKEIDFVLQIPVDEIDHVLGTLKEAKSGKNVRHRLFSQSSLSLEYIAFSCRKGIFSDPRIRLALHQGIDRKKLIDEWLKGEGWPAIGGAIPEIGSFKRTLEEKKDLTNLSAARELLNQAGYPNGIGFPEQKMYVNAYKGSSVHRMCQGIVDQWQKNLGITVKIVLCTLDERNNAIATGKASIWRSGWVADYPDPENFLTLFYGRSEKGSTKTGYFNQRYNTALDNALSETDPTKRNSLLKFCDQLIIAEAPVSPILTNDFLVMVNSRIRNFETNPMELIDFSTIFIREPQN